MFIAIIPSLKIQLLLYYEILWIIYGIIKKDNIVTYKKEGERTNNMCNRLIEIYSLIKAPIYISYVLFAIHSIADLPTTVME